MDNVDSDALVPIQIELITHERVEKFDLLTHVISHQKEVVIVCGCKGIGKTIFLNRLKNTRKDIGVICLLQGTETLNFQQIQSQLLGTIHDYHPKLAHQNLHTLFNLFEQKHLKIVLIIDDTAKLALGLMTTLTEYALHNPVLRLVFALTREQLYAKNITDRGMDEGYFIEIPALTKSQTADFLKDLFPDDYQKISDNFFNKFYRYTAGIPGKIVTHFPRLIDLERKKNRSLINFMLVSLLVMSVTLAYKYHFNFDNDELRSKLKPYFHTLKLKASALKRKVLRINWENKLLTQTEALKEILHIPKPAQITPPVSDEQWLSQQTAENYTLQLLYSSQKPSLLAVVQKHKNLQSSLKILQLNRENQENYVLLYGVFADSKTANAAISVLPIEFKRAWVRQFGSVQKEIKNP